MKPGEKEFKKFKICEPGLTCMDHFIIWGNNKIESDPLWS